MLHCYTILLTLYVYYTNQPDIRTNSTITNPITSTSTTPGSNTSMNSNTVILFVLRVLVGILRDNPVSNASQYYSELLDYSLLIF